jgi:uncharacterized membrane protein
VYRTAAVLLGIGLGGLVDNILLQQLLQLHFMVSAVVPPTDVAALRTNIRWGGVYDAVCWCTAAAGAIALYRAARHRMPVPSPRSFAGSVLLGWGAFNLLEGLLDHEILGIHHVVGGQHVILGDLLFLALAATVPIVAGAVMVRPRRDWMARRSPRRRLTPWS